MKNDNDKIDYGLILSGLLILIGSITSILISLNFNYLLIFFIYIIFSLILIFLGLNKEKYEIKWEHSLCFAGIISFILLFSIWIMILNRIVSDNQAVALYILALITSFSGYELLSGNKSKLLGEIAIKFQENLKRLVAATLILTLFVFAVFFINYTPANYIIEPKKLESNISLANESKSSIMTLSIENGGVDLENVSLQIHGNSVGIRNGEVKFRQIRENVTQIEENLPYLINESINLNDSGQVDSASKIENNIEMSIENIKKSIVDISNEIKFNENHVYIGLNATYIEKNISTLKGITAGINKSAEDEINESAKNIGIEMNKNNILIYTKPDFFDKIKLKEVKLISIMIEIPRNTLDGNYMSVIEIRANANGDEVVESVPLNLKVGSSSSDASKSNKAQDQKPAIAEYNVTLNINDKKELSPVISL